MCAQVRGAQGSAEFVTRLTFSLQRRLHTQTFADACFAGALLRRHPLQTATSPSLHSSQCWLLCAGTAKAASVVRYSESWTFPPLAAHCMRQERKRSADNATASLICLERVPGKTQVRRRLNHRSPLTSSGINRRGSNARTCWNVAKRVINANAAR